MRIVSFFARVFRGGPDSNIKAARVGQKVDLALALSGLIVIALAVAVAPGMGKLAHAAKPPVMYAGGLNFSDPPRDDEFLRTGLFAQPLVPSGPNATKPDENRDLASAVRGYAHRNSAEDVAPLTAFLEKHPVSAWRAAIELDVGAAYRSTGQFSKALAIWQEAWDEAKGYDDMKGRAVGDSAAGYLSQMEAYLGRKETLAPLIDEIKKRPVRGSARELVENSAEGLSAMNRDPGTSFLCGPMALLRILQLDHSSEASKGREVLGRARSTPNGLSLSSVQQDSVDAGMNYQMAFRSPGAPIIVPSVAHWKMGHFAAVLRELPKGHYLVGDLTFGEDLTVSRATIDDEASGYFLVPSGPLPQGWRAVDAPEGDTVWGRGYTGDNHDLGATGPSEIHAFPCGGTGGCSTWNVEASLVSLSMHDDPVGYTPPVGPQVRWQMDYSQRDAFEPSNPNFGNLGNKWTFDYLSYITFGGYDYDMSGVERNIPPGPISVAGSTVTLHRRGGGVEVYTFAPLEVLGSGAAGSIQTSAAGPFSQTYLTSTSIGDGSWNGYTRVLSDGSVETYGLGSGAWGLGAAPTFFLTSIADPQGNTITIGYDKPTMRVTSITDAVNQKTTVCYSDSYPGTIGCQQPNPAPSSNLVVTQVIDPFGRSAIFGYGQTGHLTSITDVLGITSTFHYYVDSTGLDTDLIDTLTTPYGTTHFYATGSLTPSDNDNGEGERSIKAIDPLGRTSFVEYIQGDSSGSGANCSNPGNYTWDTWHDLWVTGSAIPCEARPDDMPQPPASFPGFHQNLLQYRNTFIWDPYQYAATCPVQSANPCYPNAKIIHWLHTNQDNQQAGPLTASRIPESIKPPLESRIWFQYDNQASGVWAPAGWSTVGVGSSNQPTLVARVITDPNTGTKQTQSWQYSYNVNGKQTQVTDPFGRQLTMTYQATDPTNLGPDVGVDLLTVTNTTGCTPASVPPNGNCGDRLLTLSGYAKHRPTTSIGANGQTTSFTYNNATGQVLTVTEPLPGGNWTYSYGPGNTTCPNMSTSPNYPLKLTGPSAQGGTPVYSFTYDCFGRVESTTDPSGEYIQYAYDPADRLTQATYPDTTTVKLGYTFPAPPVGPAMESLDLTTVTDRAGNTTTRTYDADRELAAINEPNSRTTILGYWGNKTLQSIQDPNGHLTNLQTDLNGRITQITYADNTQKNLAYDDSGRPTSVSPDASNNSLTYSYNPDDTLAMIKFDSTTIDYTPDTKYKRLQNWSKSVSGTQVAYENYSYYPVGGLGANRLDVDTSAIIVPSSPGLNLTSTTTYETGTGAPGYDALDRVIGRVTTSSPASTTISDQWVFDALGRLTSEANPLDTFGYAYSDATSRVSTITSNYGPKVVATYYTPAQHDGRLNSLTYTIQQSILGKWYTESIGQYSYVMDSRHNITSFTENDQSATTQYGNTYTYDAYNQLLTADQTVTGSQSSWDNSTYGYDSAGNLTSWATEYSTIQGSPEVSTLYNSVNQITSQTITHAGETGVTTLNANYDSYVGNLLRLATSPSGTPQLSCSYEGMKDPVDCSTSSGESRFVYDGLGRLIRDTQLSTSGVVTRDESYVWCGDSMCAAFDNTSGTPTRKSVYVNQGQAGPGYDYYIRDLQGSVRNVVGERNVVSLARYQYGPYGNQTLVSGSGSASDFGFAGMFTDSVTGLSFAQNRVYSAALGRWLSRDPIGFTPAFMGGAFNATNLNLYAYVANNPTSFVDPSGNCPNCGLAVAGAFVGGVIGGLSAYASNSDITAGVLSGIVSGAAAGFTAGGSLGFWAGAGLTAAGNLGGAGAGAEVMWLEGKPQTNGDLAGSAASAVIAGIFGRSLGQNFRAFTKGDPILEFILARMAQNWTSALIKSQLKGAPTPCPPDDKQE